MRREGSGLARRNRCAFTLFEIALSLGLLAFGVTSVLVLFPMGIKAQQLSRFQIYAAAKAEEMVEQFNGAHPDNATTDSEGPDLWESTGAYRSQAWDLEARLDSHRYGMMGLPTALAQRLDSDNDEIQQILSSGGKIYYAQPMAASDTEEMVQTQAPPQEIQKLIIGVTGHAQQNCVHMFALKNWPYTVATPSPPLHSIHLNDSWLPPVRTATSGGYWNIFQWPQVGEDWLYCWETAVIPGVAIPGTDPDLQKVFDWPEPAGSSNLPIITGAITHYGFLPYAANPLPFGTPSSVDFKDGTSTTLSSSDACIRYVQAALWYCQQKSLVGGSGITSSFWNPAGLPAANAIPTFEPSTPDDKKWMQVQAMRFLSHAATSLTGWFPLTAGAPGGSVPDLTTGITIRSATLDGRAGAPDLVITNDLIHYYHERAVRLMMEFAARYPYDWAVPRPIERSIMSDYPLLQLDMYTTPLTGTIFGTGPAFGSGVAAQPAAQWRPLSPRPIRHIGLGQIYPVNQNPQYLGAPPNPMGGQNKLDGTIVPGGPSGLMGNLDHYNLGRPFDASERCREIVFWTADWQSYEDFETLPSAPVDASKYPIAGPRMTGTGSASGATTYRKWEDRMWDLDFVDPHLFAFRNPEKTELFINANPGNAPTGTDTTSWEILNVSLDASSSDKGSGLENRKIFNGLYGADRNFNKRIDRGPVPR
nr:hypothetical protein [Planctomycetota bacterium]